MNSNDALELCAAVEALLSAHAGDDGITGRAREDAQREFARHARPILTLAIEKIRDLVGEVASLRTGILESEGALLRMWEETQAEVERLREKMTCGHPGACLVSADEGTAHCAWCEDKARWEQLIAMGIENSEEYRKLLVESKRRVTELETEVKLNAQMLAAQCDLAREAETALARERMRATSQAGSVPK